MPTPASIKTLTLSTLLRDQRFFPLFVCQFWSAFADNAFRSALVVMATYNSALVGTLDRRLIVTIIGLVFVLPFFLFSSLAGQIADKYEKSTLVKITKGLEIGIVLIALYGFYVNSLGVLLITLFLSSTQSTFFSPLKYSLLPEYLEPHELVAGNGLIEASTFLAILLGTMAGGLLSATHGHQILFINMVMLVSVVLGWASSLYLLKAKAAEPKLKLNYNVAQETIALVKQGMRDRVIFLTIIGISWFWFVGGVFLAQITTYGRDIINGNENVATLFLIMFSIGIGLGSLSCYHLTKGSINTRLVPWGALGITIFTIDFVFASKLIRITSPEYVGIFQFLSHGLGWRILFDLLMIAFSGGLYTVPLYVMLQKQAGPTECSRMIAVNNIANAFFMVISSVLSLALLALGVSILTIFLIVGLVNLIVMIRISRLVPESLLQLVLQAVFKLLFKVDVKGLEHFQAAGKRVLIISNHTSFIDAALLFAFIPEKLSFAIYSFYIDKWWIRLITPGINLFPVNPSNPMATKTLIEHLRQDRKCVIFPEGRITETGSLMKIFDGPGMIADKAEATVLPIQIDGAQYSLFSRLKGKIERKAFPKIRVTILPPYHLEAPETLMGRERRKVLSSQIYTIMTEMMFAASSHQSSLLSALIDAGKLYGMRNKIVEDTDRKPLSYRKLLVRVFALGKHLTSLTVHEEPVGILLPTSVGTFASFFALHSIGRIPTMLNPSLGPSALIACAQLARLRIILTSRRFVTTARLEPLIDIIKQHFTVVYLEDVAAQMTPSVKLMGALKAYCPCLSFRKMAREISDNDTAVILFTSGSEGLPKAVALSHKNINSNRQQIAAHIDLSPQDVLLNVLPMFHSFGLIASFLPVLVGVKTFFYPSPLHYRMIPIIAYDINATLFFATDTFLNRYGRLAHPYDFYAIRYVFAGAEKLREETRKMWLDKFGLNIFEGYGTTETSPVLAVNTRMYNKVNTVGRFLPAIQYHLEPIEGIHEGGCLHVKGPNVMSGYLDPNTGHPSPPSSCYGEGWYNTGDIVRVDTQGFVEILGRLKRFAKVGGEMISLVAVEEKLYKASPEYHYAVFAYPDDRKGEQLVLLTTSPQDRDQIIKTLKTAGCGEVMFPRRVFTIPEIPVLATGKVDFQKTKVVADARMREAV